jgi:Domain of unknown function (DUF4184)
VPFTGSHPAAVLPFLRLGLPASGLVIGSLAPDVPMFVPMPISIELTHSLVGPVTVDLAVGLLVYAGWHVLLGPALVALAPGGLRARLATSASRPAYRPLPGRAAALLLALCIGALTHVVWDAFTHEQLWGPAHVPLLARQYGPFPGYEWTQHASTVAGLGILAVWCRRWYRATTVGPVSAPTHLRAVIVGRASLVLATMGGAVYGIAFALREAGASLDAVLFFAATRGGLAVVTALAAIGLVTRVAERPLSSVAGRDRT